MTSYSFAASGEKTSPLVLTEAHRTKHRRHHGRHKHHGPKSANASHGRGSIHASLTAMLHRHLRKTEEPKEDPMFHFKEGFTDLANPTASNNTLMADLSRIPVKIGQEWLFKDAEGNGIAPANPDQLKELLEKFNPRPEIFALNQHIFSPAHLFVDQHFRVNKEEINIFPWSPKQTSKFERHEDLYALSISTPVYWVQVKNTPKELKELGDELFLFADQDGNILQVPRSELWPRAEIEKKINEGTLKPICNITTLATVDCTHTPPQKPVIIYGMEVESKLPESVFEYTGPSNDENIRIGKTKGQKKERKDIEPGAVRRGSVGGVPLEERKKMREGMKPKSP